MGDLLVVGSKIRALVKKNKMNMASDFLPALDKEVQAIVLEKVKIAQAFGKKTVSRQTLGMKK